MAQGTMLAHMQASVGVLSRMRSDKAFAHMRTPAKDVLIARSDAVTAHMQSSRCDEEETLPDRMPAYMRSLEEEYTLECVESATIRGIILRTR